MAETRVYVSYAPSDEDLVGELFSTVRNLPVTVALAEEELEPGKVRRDLEGQLANSDVVVSLLTDAGAEDHWVNQELGYAKGADVPIVPVVERDSYRRGYVEDVDAVEYDPEHTDRTVFEIVGRLRSELAPVGSLSTPNWFVSFRCSACGEAVQLGIDDLQRTLWQRYQHGHLLTAQCEECDASYEFNPATLGFVRRVRV